MEGKSSKEDEQGGGKSIYVLAMDGSRWRFVTH